MNASMKQAATTRSARLPCTITRGSSGGRPSICSWNSVSSETRAGPSSLPSWATAGGPEQARRGRGSADHPVRRSRDPSTLGALGLFHVAHATSAPSPSAPSVLVTPLRGDPHRDEHQEAQPAEEDHQALGDRPGPAEREAARVGLDPGLRDVGDDVALGLRGHRAVGEHRHGLGPGQHRRVDLGRRGLGQRRRVLAVGQRAARPGEAVALRAVGAEQLLAERGVSLPGVNLLGGRDRGAAAERGDVAGDVVDLPPGERHRLALVLRADFLGRHAAGRHLEVDRGRARADQAGRLRGALGVEAVAARAGRLEQVLAGRDVLLCPGRGRGRLTPPRRVSDP